MNILGIRNPTPLLKDLLNADKIKNVTIACHVNNALIDLKNAVKRKEIHKNENPDKVINIIE